MMPPARGRRCRQVVDPAAMTVGSGHDRGPKASVGIASHRELVGLKAGFVLDIGRGDILRDDQAAGAPQVDDGTVSLQPKGRMLSGMHILPCRAEFEAHEQHLEGKVRETAPRDGPEPLTAIPGDQVRLRGDQADAQFGRTRPAGRPADVLHEAAADTLAAKQRQDSQTHEVANLRRGGFESRTTHDHRSPRGQIKMHACAAILRDPFGRTRGRVCRCVLRPETEATGDIGIGLPDERGQRRGLVASGAGDRHRMVGGGGGRRIHGAAFITSSTWGSSERVVASPSPA